jgi:hypothetical protein
MAPFAMPGKPLKKVFRPACLPAGFPKYRKNFFGTSLGFAFFGVGARHVVRERHDPSETTQGEKKLRPLAFLDARILLQSYKFI